MSYEKQNWATGDIITADKLNHMEDGVFEAQYGGLTVVAPKQNVTIEDGGAGATITLAEGFILPEYIPDNFVVLVDNMELEYNTSFDPVRYDAFDDDNNYYYILRIGNGLVIFAEDMGGVPVPGTYSVNIYQKPKNTMPDFGPTEADKILTVTIPDEFTTIVTEQTATSIYDEDWFSSYFVPLSITAYQKSMIQNGLSADLYIDGDPYSLTIVYENGDYYAEDSDGTVAFAYVNYQIGDYGHCVVLFRNDSAPTEHTITMIAHVPKLVWQSAAGGSFPIVSVTLPVDEGGINPCPGVEYTKQLSQSFVESLSTLDSMTPGFGILIAEDTRYMTIHLAYWYYAGTYAKNMSGGMGTAGGYIFSNGWSRITIDSSTYVMTVTPIAADTSGI